jgi:hypothetical protein
MIRHPEPRAGSAICAEALELRVLLSTSFARITHHGTLLITGTSGNDTIAVVAVDPAILKVRFNGQTSDFATSGMKRVRVDAGDGNDSVDLSAAPRMQSTVAGDSGNDTLIGSRGDDSIDGGAGDDQLDGQIGHNTLAGGEGVDVADYSRRSSALSIVFPQIDTLVDGSAAGGGAVDTLTVGVEAIIGSAFDDQFAFPQSFGTRPTALGGGGDDFFAMGNGTDAVAYGGAGNDESMSMTMVERPSVSAARGTIDLCRTHSLRSTASSVAVAAM